MVREMCYVRNTDMKYAYTQEQESHLGLMRIQCNCKPQGFKQGCVECVMIQTKISNGFLPRNTRFKRGQSSSQDLLYSNNLNWGQASFLTF